MDNSTVPNRPIAAADTASADGPTLFDESTQEIKMERDSAAASNPPPEDLPHLAIVRPEDHEDAIGDEGDDAADLIAESSQEGALPPPEAETPPPSDCDASHDEDQMWPSDDDGTAEDIILSEPQTPDAADGEVVAVSAGGEAMAAEVSPTVTGKPMPELPPRGNIARLGVQKPGVIPKRIGSGRLVPARLTWKPGDLFADSKKTKGSLFRWEVMLTSACITAACGMGCIWLLRTIFV